MSRTTVISPVRFGQALSRERRRAGLSVQQLADRLGHTYQHVYGLERGLHSPSWQTVQRLASILGVDVSDFC